VKRFARRMPDLQWRNLQVRRAGGGIAVSTARQRRK